jgi:hypothetical protein
MGSISPGIADECEQRCVSVVSRAWPTALVPLTRLPPHGCCCCCCPACQAYTALALFNLLRLPLAFLPMMITMLINALVALKRIGAFLEKPETKEDGRASDASTPPGTIQVSGGGAALWRMIVSQQPYVSGCLASGMPSHAIAAPTSHEPPLLWLRMP